MTLMNISRGYHSSVTSLTSLWSRASHIIASDEYLGDAMNNVMTEILTKSLHHDISPLGRCVTNYITCLYHNLSISSKSAS